MAIALESAVDDVELVELGGTRIAALWSERAGTFVRIGSGEAFDAPLRLGPRCDAGVVGLFDRDRLLVACGRRAIAGHDSGGVFVLELDGLRVRVGPNLGSPGTDGFGVALAVDAQGRLHVGWIEKNGSASRAWIRGMESHAAIPLSNPRFRASAPSLLPIGNGIASSWSEHGFDARGKSVGRIMIAPSPLLPRAIAEVRYEPATPQLSSREGGLLLSYRDKRAPAPRARMYMVALDPGTLEFEGSPEPSNFANARGEPCALPCNGDVFAIAPRKHTRREHLIAVVRYDRDLARDGRPEQQLYEYGAAFEHVDAACIDDHPLLLFASRPTKQQRNGSVRLVGLRCEPFLQ